MGLRGVNEWFLVLGKMASTCGEGDCDRACHTGRWDWS